MTRAFVYPFAAVLSLVSVSASKAQITPSVDGIVYVDVSASPSGNGASWENAASSLADAVLAAHENTDISEIRVARGTYYPEHMAGDGDQNRDKAFVFTRGNLRVLGGYPAGGAGERDPAVNPSILSGDIDENNILDIGNTYHIVITATPAVNNTFVFDGFTVTGAYSADLGGNLPIQVAGNSVIRRMGAWINVNSSPAVSNSTIRNNSMYFGGGWFNFGGNPGLENVVISSNSATRGGGWYNNAGNVSLVGVEITGNTALHGGGWYHGGGNASLASVTIANNTAQENGGGWYTFAGGNVVGSGAEISRNTAIRGGGWYNDLVSPSVTDVTIDYNEAVHGGGWYNNGGTPKLTRVALTNNSAGSNGGGWYNDLATAPELTDMLISGNRAGTNGGGWYNFSGNPVVINAVIENNIAETNGGGWYHRLDGAQRARITNTVIRGNAAFGAGGGWFNSSSSNPVLVNAIVSGNEARFGAGWYNAGGGPALTNSTIAGNYASDEAGGWFHLAGNAVLANSIIYGNASGATGTSGIQGDNLELMSIAYSLVQGYDGGTNNLPGAADPLFEELVVAGEEEPTVAGNYNLKPGSPAVNKGNPATDPGLFPKDDNDAAIDLSGNSRIYGSQIDLGAYELIHDSALPVTLTAFTAALRENAVQLTWQTTAEVNFSHFDVECSFDGKSFKRIGTVMPDGGTGGWKMYSFWDRTKMVGSSGPIRYYRLKMVDNDHTFTYSPIISVKKDGAAGVPAVRLYPNPAKNGKVVLETEDDPGRMEVKVFDMLGRETGIPVLLSQGKAELETRRLPAGLYLVHLMGAETVEIMKLVIE